MANKEEGNDTNLTNQLDEFSKKEESYPIRDQGRGVKTNQHHPIENDGEEPKPSRLEEEPQSQRNPDPADLDLDMFVARERRFRLSLTVAPEGAGACWFSS